MGQMKSVGTPFLKNYKKIAYHSGTQNWDIDQDHNGNVYFANNEGLLQFDGTSWRSYPIPSSKTVRSLKFDEVTGRVYVGGYNEFGYFESDPHGALFYRSLSAKLLDGQKKDFEFVWKVHLFKGAVVFQTFSGAYVYSQDSLKVIDAPSRFQFSFRVSDKLYFQDVSQGLMNYEDNGLTIIPNTSFFNDKEIWGIFKMPDNSLLLATLNNGLFIYEKGKVQPWKTEANEFMIKNGSLGGIITDDYFIQLNSVLNGFIICNPNGKIVQHVNLNKGLQNNTLLSSFIDSQKNLWVGLDNGISYVNESSPVSYLGSSFNLSTVYASVGYADKVYAATNQGVFYRSLKNERAGQNFKLVTGTSAQTWNIQVIDHELVAASNRGALILNDGQVSKILDTRGYYGFKKIPSHPDYIIGSNYEGFALFEKKRTRLEFKGQIQGFQKSSNFFEIDEDYLWLLKDGELYKMELSNDLQNFTEIQKIEQKNFPDQSIDGLHKIDGKVFFRSQNRFYNFYKTNNMFRENDAMDMRFRDVADISQITQDKFGNLWFTSKESLGVFMKDKDDKPVQRPFIDLTGNLLQNYLSVNAIDQHTTYIGLTDGLALYNPEINKQDTTNLKVFIRSFTFGQDTLMMGNPQKITFEKLLPYSENNVKFTFSSTDFQNTRPMEYAYKLKPFDKNWSEWSTNAIKEYTNLREGDYTMQVKAKTGGGLISTQDTLNFTVSPPWYRSLIAYISYFGLFIFSIYLTVFFIKIKIRKDRYYQTIEQRKLYLEKESRIRKERYKLEKEIAKLKRDKLKTKLLSKDKELVNNSLQIINKNKVLNEIIKKLKEFDTKSLNDLNRTKINKLQSKITKELNTDKNFSSLEKHIKNVHFEFLKRLKEKHPGITPRELDLSIYLLLNMSTKEIAEIMNISTGGVELARYRLRKKLKLKRKQSLTGFMMKI